MKKFSYTGGLIAGSSEFVMAGNASEAEKVPLYLERLGSTVAFENMAPQPLLSSAQSESNMIGKNSSAASQMVKPLQLFRHGMSLQLRGSFASSLKYLKTLESQPWRFMWNSLHYEVEEYPNGNLTIKIETLSAKQYWLGV